MANTDDKSLPDQAIEALLYAPIGIAYEILDRLPTWVARGKSQATITRVVGKMAVQKGQDELGDAVSDIFGVKLRDDAQKPQNGAGGTKTAGNPPKPTKAATGPKTASVKAKKSSTEKSPAKKSSAKNSATKNSATKKSTGKKSSSKKASSKQSTSKQSTSKKASSKKASSKKAASKKASPKPSTSKKSTKKSPAKPKAVVEADLALASYGSMPASQIVKRLDSLSAAQLENVRVFEQANRRRVTVLNRIRQIQRDA